MDSGIPEQNDRGLAASPSPLFETNASLPTGTVTFLMTDIEGSTRAWNASPRSARLALERHDRIIHEQVERFQGQIVESGREGDGVLAVFARATDAIACAVEIQRELQREEWPAGAVIRVRIGVHTGEAVLRSGHYAGAPLYRCARLMGTAHGGQILISHATEELVAEGLPEGLELHDLGQHRLRDLSRVEHVYQLWHADLRREFPPLKSLEAKRTNLPEPLTSFVGRQSDLSGLKKLIKESRLVTLLGPGGIGKSRLAIRLAEDMADRWPDGAWWVDLSVADNSQQVAGVVATALRLPGAGPGLDVVSAWLGPKDAVLILDNCEHLIAPCADFCRYLLQSCPRLRLLATSREALGLEGEARWPLSPLTEPDAMSLFEQRARLVVPDFKITDSNRKEVTQICRRLDELPLAIELAASRLGAMSEREISRQLVDRLDLLARRDSGQPRQQTITATIDWSYRLLSEAEAALFRRLAVFRGGFALESVNAICGDHLVPDVTSALAGLVEKSMVVVERVDDGEVRYRPLELQVVYAREKLAATDEVESMHKRHYDYFVEALSSLDPTPDVSAPGAVEEKWKERELDNLWAALRWARAHETDMGLGLASEVAFIPAGDLNEARVMLTDLLARSPAQGRDRMNAIAAAAGLAFVQGDANEQLRLAQVLKQLSTDAGDNRYLVVAMHEIGSAQSDIGRLEEAEVTFIEGIRLLHGSGNVRLLEMLNNDLGCLALRQGRFESARSILADCVESLKTSNAGSIGQLAATVESLANAELGCGEIERADRTWKESLTISRDVNDFTNVIGCLGGLARSATERGDHLRAIRLAAAHSRLSEEFSYRDSPWWLEQLHLSLEISRSKVGSRASGEAWEQGRAMTLARASEYALEDWSDEKPESGQLTRRETEVARLVATGVTNREIANKLFIAERTVEGHVEKIRNKLGFHSRAEIAVWATGRGLVKAK